MATDPKQPLEGERHIDASELDFLVDLPEGGTHGLQRSHEGIKEVMHEIEANQASLGALVGLSDIDVQELQEIERQLQAISRFKPAVDKLSEMLRETQAHLEDRREKIVGATAKSVEAKSNTPRGEELFAKYEKTRNYRSARGKKAVATRRKNATLKTGS